MEIDLGRVLDAHPAMTWTALPDGKINFINRRWSEYTGLGLDEAHGWEWRAVVDPDNLPKLLERWQSILASGEPGDMEARVRRVDGQYCSLLIQCNPVRDAAGRIFRWCGVVTDIDDLRRAKETLRERDLYFQSIVDSIPIPVAVTTPSGEIERLNQPTLDYFGKTLEELKSWKVSEVVHPGDLERTVAAQVEAHRNGRPYNVESRHRRADGIYRWYNVHGLPLRDPQGNILRWLHLLIDIEDRKRAEDALRESERQARAIVDGIPGLVAILTPDGRTDVVNQQMAEYHGLTPEELRKWATNRTIHDDDLPGVTEIFNRAIASGMPYEIEYRLRRFDGVYRWFYSRGVPLHDPSGHIICWYALQTDIDDRKRAEASLRESERESRLILDSIPARVGIYDADGIRVSANRQAIELSGFPADVDWRKIFHPDDLGFAENRWRECLAKEEPFECEYRARMADGTYRWHLGRRVPMRDEQGRVIRWYGVSHDIEDRKRAEQALATSERNLLNTINTIPALAWTATPDGLIDFYNEQYLEYVGRTLEQVQGWGWTEAFHPDDLPKILADWDVMLAAGRAGETEGRVRRHDGQYRWFMFRTNPMRDENGNIIKWYGVNTEIDDRKRSEDGFRAIVETTPECVKVVARDGTVLRTNAAGAVMAGVPSVDAVIGQRFVDFVAPEHQARYREFHEKVCSGQKGFLEFDLVNAQGIRRHMETHAAPLRESDGSIVQLGVTRDMTERKRAEDALRRSEAFLAEGQHLARVGNLSWNVTSGEIIWSEQLYRIFEFEPGKAVTLDQIASRVHPEDMPMMADMVERAQRGERDFEYQHRIVLPDQSVKYLHLIAHRAGCHSNDGVIEYIGAVLDITQRRLSEEAVEKLRSELAQVTRIMSLGALTASIAHEVNQPLSGIITNAGTCLRMLAADPPNVDGARETARRTIRDGNRAADVIARLRSLFTKKAVTIEPVDLNEAVREVIALSWNDFQRRRVVLRTELDDGLQPVGGDRIQLQQVIMNLLRNAVDAMNEVEDRPRRLLIRSEAGGDDLVRLSVQDAGIGFGPLGAEKLFQAFYTTKSEGMGIGLSVSRSIVESHGGRLWAEGNNGPGATFFVSIPKYSGDEIPVQATGANFAPVISSAQAAARIL
ncbi:PAS domain S-box protein [Mesorhizobium sp. B2-8-9]|uniref:PAS domain S-box protein n=1 Tax=Mesorhizobium sp. B2-8-9 TaxID=2589899 RepID=UPI0015E2B224|nr:PAS domain S-box protein [Mesorhizobium sp. B2-8-9]